MTELFRQVWDSEIVPKEWRKSIYYSLQKQEIQVQL